MKEGTELDPHLLEHACHIVGAQETLGNDK